MAVKRLVENTISTRKQAENYIHKEFKAAESFLNKKGLSPVISVDGKEIIFRDTNDYHMNVRCEIKMVPQILIYNEVGDIVGIYEHDEVGSGRLAKLVVDIADI